MCPLEGLEVVKFADQQNSSLDAEGLCLASDDIEGHTTHSVCLQHHQLCLIHSRLRGSRMVIKVGRGTRTWSSTGMSQRKVQLVHGY